MEPTDDRRPRQESAHRRLAWLLLRGVVAAVVLTVMAAGTLALAADHLAPLSDSPTATEMTDSAPLGEAMRDFYVGSTGVWDPQNGLVSPDQTSFDIQIQAAHNGSEIFFRYEVPTPLASYYHDSVVYRDGAWIRMGDGPVGTEPHGLHEDRVTMMVDDGSVRGFANQGGWITCHEDLHEPVMYAGAKNDDVEAHPVLGEVLGAEESTKYLPQSRDAGPEWWRANGWDAMTLDNLDAYQQRHDAGVFVDLWHWRSNRSGPIGYSDDQYVFDQRSSDEGRGMYSTNWDSEVGQPLLMFDAAATGYAALNWDEFQAQSYGWEGQFFLAEEVNAVPFDPNRQWQDGDVLPRRYLRVPADSRGSIESDAALVRDGDGWRWQVELRRAMDTGDPLGDKAFQSGRSYSAAVAVHRLATGSRWHFVSLPFRIGIDMPADVTAQRFDGDRPDWTVIEPKTLTLVYPGQTNWEWLTSEDHPGSTAVRADAMSVIGCHDVIGLGEANKAIEPRLLGLSSYAPGVAGPLGGLLEPANATLIFAVLALGTLGVAVAAGLIRRRRT